MGGIVNNDTLAEIKAKAISDERICYFNDGGS
jgi:hypothetical protein